MLAFTSVYFLETRLSNGLRPFGIKIFGREVRLLLPVVLKGHGAILPSSNRSLGGGESEEAAAVEGGHDGSFLLIPWVLLVYQSGV